ncbi:MAG: amidohydrolase family protein [Acidobacteriota bacterium]
MRPSVPRLRSFLFLPALALCFLLALSISTSSAVQPTSTPRTGQPREIVIRGGWLFDGVSTTRVRNSGIVVRNGKFMEVGADLGGRDLSGARIIELGDEATILPGILDLHAHYNVELLGEGRVEETTYNPLIYLANGVTSTFPAGEFDPEEMIEARQRIDSGKQIGPRIFNSGPYFGASRPGWNEAMTRQQIRDEVDDWAARGARGFKAKLLHPGQMRALIDQAHKHGLTVTSHLHNYEWGNHVDPRDAILMGIDRIEHSIARPGDMIQGKSLPGSPEFDAMAALFIKHHVYFDATMSVYTIFASEPDPQVVVEWVDERKFFTPYIQERIARQPIEGDETYTVLYKGKRKELEAFYQAGGGHLLTVGSDHPSEGRYVAGFSVHRELLGMVRAGVPPVAVLRAATINGARALGLSDRLGSIETGKLADLYVVTGNPLEDIRAARNVTLVMKSGRVYDPKLLLKEAEGKIGPSGPEDHAAWIRK